MAKIDMPAPLRPKHPRIAGWLAIGTLAAALAACDPANPERPRFQQTVTFDNGVTVHIYTAGPGQIAFSAKVEGSTIIFNNQKLDLQRGDEVSVVARADKSITIHKGRL